MDFPGGQEENLNETTTPELFPSAPPTPHLARSLGMDHREQERQRDTDIPSEPGSSQVNRKLNLPAGNPACFRC